MSQSLFYRVIGLMSGTSLDGLDIALCEFKYLNDQWVYKLEKTLCVPYPKELKEQLKNSNQLSASELLIFNNYYGEWLGKQVNLFKSDISPPIDFIASHGHTIFHQPEVHFTYQLGAGQNMANISKSIVICDFRSKDVSLGGQGAPLVPIGDQLLFGDYDYCLNLGGIANISFKKDKLRKAFDIVHVNMILNDLANSIGLSYDNNGELAKQGVFIETLYNELNALPFFNIDNPKSLGFEEFERDYIPVLDQYRNHNVKDLLHTTVMHVAFQIAQVIDKNKKSQILITGGGVKNSFLIESISKLLSKNVEIIIPDIQIVDYKEALIFAFMGVLRSRNEINCLSSVTGAIEDCSGGVIYYPNELPI